MLILCVTCTDSQNLIKTLEVYCEPWSVLYLIRDKTDNGSEFSNPKEIEKRSIVPCNRTNVFYCALSAHYQKGACEVNHELIRRILPKGSSFGDLTQKDIFWMMDHINSYKRKKLNNRSSYEAFSFYYGEDVLKKLECSPVAAGNIILRPKLLKT